MRITDPDMAKTRLFTDFGQMNHFLQWFGGKQADAEF
jgi:hypothetical protein